jgi:hypothetical protein
MRDKRLMILSGVTIAASVLALIPDSAAARGGFGGGGFHGGGFARGGFGGGFRGAGFAGSRAMAVGGFRGGALVARPGWGGAWRGGWRPGWGAEAGLDGGLAGAVAGADGAGRLRLASLPVSPLVAGTTAIRMRTMTSACSGTASPG